jgi:D-glycero-alpha-D-manno-heptose 1-phosphate guanylyltransferase
MQAIVLAGGLGTRLRGVVPDLPKPMAPVAGRPFLEWILDRLVDARFDDAVMAVGYRHEAIHDHFGDRYRGLALRYSVEDRPLGTGGAIRLAAAVVDGDPLFVLNGDTYLEVDYRAMLAAHVAVGESMTLAAHRVADVGRYGALDVRDGRVCGFVEKGTGGVGLINAGTYLVSRRVLDRMPADRAFSFEQDLLVPEMRTIRPLAFVAEGLFIDIGVPEDFARAQELFARRAADT